MNRFRPSKRGYVKFMQARLSLVTLALLLSACQLQAAPGTSDGANSLRPTGVAAKKAASPMPAAKARVSQANKDALVRAIHNALGATRVSKVSLALNETSGIIANNGSSILSDNGLGLISDNGLGLGGTTAKAYRTLAAAVTGDYDVETDDLIYRFHDATSKQGEIKVYEKDAFKAATTDADREKALLDHFRWDDIGFALDAMGPPVIATVTFPMRKVFSKRIPFADRLTTKEKVKVVDLQAQRWTTLGWEYDIDIASKLADGGTDTSSFKAVAGEADLDWFVLPNGQKQTIPKRLAVTGTNSVGSYTGTVDYPSHQFDLTHTATTGGARTLVHYLSPPKGTNQLTITCEEAKLQVKVAIDKDQTQGTGQVLDVSGATPQVLAPLTYDGSGLATISFPDGTTAKAQLF